MFPASALDGSITDRFEAIVRQFPARLAVQDTTVSFTYAELAKLVEQIAAATAAATEGRAGPVAVMIPADANFPAAMLGVLAAGRAYVALDVDAPVKRQESIIADLNPCAIVASGKHVGDARTLLRTIPVIDLEDCLKIAPSAPIPKTRPDDLAAIYYTSGSTGNPKGIAWNHRTIVHRVRSFTDAANISCSDRTLLLASPSVSASYRSLYCALLNGAAVHILSPRNLGVRGLINEIRIRGITIYHSVPTLMRRIAENLDGGERLETIRLAHLGGDRVKWEDIDRCKQIFSREVRIHISLSSAEVGPCIQWFVDDAVRQTATYPPVGRPAPGWKVTILGDDGRPVADGENGEVAVSSGFLALGYWRGSDHQVDALPSDPLDPAARAFKSGDRARRRADGLIEFIGRNDARIKLHGHRIELAEVESVLNALPKVSDAAVVVRRGADDIPLSLVAYVELYPSIHGMLPRHIQSMLAQRLPRYMVPSRIHVIDELPRLPSFKINRRALLRMDAAQANNHIDRHNDPLLDQVARIFEAVIGLKGATAEDTVASLGGDSLQEIKVFIELERRYGVTIPNDVIERRTTIGAIARRIASQIALHSAGAPSR